jgi:maleylpyruvate isomerase
MATEASPAPSTAAVPDPTETLTRVLEATAHLLATAEQFDDTAVREPSLLPGWTRGHVLTHAARNADALVRLMTWAATGTVTPMYASPEARDTEIAAGAGRSAEQLLADLREACERFATQAARMEPGHWSAEIEARRGGPQLAAWVPWWRLEEVLVHHVDLDAAFSPAHWPQSFTDPELAMVTARYNNPVFTPDSPAFRLHAEDSDAWYGVRSDPQDASVPLVRGPSAALFAWLIGRSNGDGLNVEPHGSLPKPPEWK